MKNKVLEFIVPSLLAVILTIALLYVFLEPPAMVARFIHFTFNTPDFLPNTELVENFIRTNHIRPIAYTCLAVVAFFILLGFITEKTGLSSAGAIVFFLPIFGYFASQMFFLAGIGMVRTLWLPFWPDAMHLGDIVYLPYIIIVYPFMLIGGKIGVVIGVFLPLLLVVLGFLLFLLSIQNWLRAKLQGKGIVDSWVYRFSRHPQYLGWLVWSYGLMLLLSNVPTVRGGENPGASLPWVITSLIIICVALAEEIQMERALGAGYDSYRRSTPFMFPIPKSIAALIKAPLRLSIKKARPENRKELLVTFVVYLAVIILLSLPFLLFGTPDIINQYWYSRPL